MCLPDLNSVSLADVTAGLNDYLKTQSDLITNQDSSPHQQEIVREFQTSSTDRYESTSGPQEHSTPVVNNLPAHSPDFEALEKEINSTSDNMPMRGMYTGPMPTGNRPSSGNMSPRKTPRTTPKLSQLSPRSFGGNKNISESTTNSDKTVVPVKSDVLKKETLSRFEDDSGVVVDSYSGLDTPKHIHMDVSAKSAEMKSNAKGHNSYSDATHSGIHSDSVATVEKRHSSGASDGGTGRPRRKVCNHDLCSFM